jgi:hypothetical protein
LRAQRHRREEEPGNDAERDAPVQYGSLGHLRTLPQPATDAHGARCVFDDDPDGGAEG